MPPLLLGIGLLAWLLLVSPALSRRILNRLHLGPEDWTERAVLSIGLGLGMLQWLPFLLLALGIGQAQSLRTALMLLTLALLPDIFAVLRGGRTWLGVKRSIAWWQWTLCAILAAGLAAMFLRALCPVTDSDGLSYHLSAAVRLLQAGRFVYLPTLTYTNWPLGIESLFAILLAIHPLSPVGLIQFIFGATILAATYVLGRRLVGRFAGTTAAAALLLYPVFWEEMTQAEVDLGPTLFSLLALISLTHVREGPEQRAWLWLSALFAGMAATSKLLGIWVIAAMTLLILAGSAIPGKGKVSACRMAMSFAAVAALFMSPWFVKTWILTGNPIYPMGFGVLGGYEWTAEGWARMQKYFLLMNTPPSMSPTLPALLASRAALAGSGFILAAAVFLATRRSRLALPARFAASFIALVLMGSGYNLRFLLAAFPPVVICACASLRSRERHLAWLVCAIAVMLALRLAWRAGEPHLLTAARFSLMGDGREEYLRNRLPDYPVVEFANAKLPADSRILVSTWEESNALYRPFAMRANYWLQDSVHYDSQERLTADLRRLGVTHLVLSPMEDPWCAKSYVCSGRAQTETRALTALAEKCGVRLFEHSGIALYRLDIGH